MKKPGRTIFACLLAHFLVLICEMKYQELEGIYGFFLWQILFLEVNEVLKED